MADIKIKPLGDRVLIEAVEAVEETMGGILIPDSAKEKLDKFISIEYYWSNNFKK